MLGMKNSKETADSGVARVIYNCVHKKHKDNGFTKKQADRIFSIEAKAKASGYKGQLIYELCLDWFNIKNSPENVDEDAGNTVGVEAVEPEDTNFTDR